MNRIIQNITNSIYNYINFYNNTKNINKIIVDKVFENTYYYVKNILDSSKFIYKIYYDSFSINILIYDNDIRTKLYIKVLNPDDLEYFEDNIIILEKTVKKLYNFVDLNNIIILNLKKAIINYINEHKRLEKNFKFFLNYYIFQHVKFKYKIKEIKIIIDPLTYKKYMEFIIVNLYNNDIINENSVFNINQLYSDLYINIPKRTYINVKIENNIIIDFFEKNIKDIIIYNNDFQIKWYYY